MLITYQLKCNLGTAKTNKKIKPNQTKKGSCWPGLESPKQLIGLWVLQHNAVSLHVVTNMKCKIRSSKNVRTKGYSAVVHNNKNWFQKCTKTRACTHTWEGVSVSLMGWPSNRNRICLIDSPWVEKQMFTFKHHKAFLWPQV